MKSSIRFFSRVVTLLCIALILPLSLSAQSDAPPETLTVGDSVEDVSRRAEFLLDAEDGQTVTLRWEGRYRSSDRCNAPLEEIIDVDTEVTNADGDALEQVSLLYTPTSTTQVYALEGTAPYQISAVICGGSNMTLSLIDGDAITRAEQPALSVGDTVSIAAASVGEGQLLAFPLNVQVGDVFTVAAHFTDYPMYAAVVRDANGQIVASDFSARLPQGLSLLAPVYTVAGAVPYRLEFPALPLYNAGYAERFGEMTNDVSYSVQLQSGNTAIEDGGLLPIGTRVEGVLSPGKAVIYTLGVEEGETVTLRREFSQGTPISYFLNADGDNADIVEFFVNDATSMNWFMRFAGPLPYTYYFSGEGSYALLLEAGNTLEQNELGTLAPGGVVRGTVPAQDDRIDYITLNVNPETTVTLNWGIPQAEFSIWDSEGDMLYSLNDDWNDGYAIVDLSQGTPPFIVSLDDARYAGQPYTLTLAEGETPLSPDAASANPSGNAEATPAGDTQSEVDTEADAACIVSAGSDINQRSGPGTNFDVSGTLAGGSSAVVDGQAAGADGFKWYRLSASVWVRGDLVTASEGCSAIPEVTP